MTKLSTVRALLTGMTLAGCSGSPSSSTSSVSTTGSSTGTHTASGTTAASSSATSIGASTGASTTGAATTGATSTGSSGTSSTGSTGSTTGGVSTYGQVAVDQFGGEILLFASFSASPIAPAFSCVGATQTVGACCYVPSNTDIDGGGSAAVTPNGGDVFVDDVTLGATNPDAGLLCGASPIPANMNGSPDGGFEYFDVGCGPWTPGDELIAYNDDAGAVPLFRIPLKGIEQPAFSPLWIANNNPTFLLDGGLTFTWTPDPNATAMQITLSDVGLIFCSTPDSAGTVTIDHSLLANFVAGDMCQPFCGYQRIAQAQATNDGLSVTFLIDWSGGGGATFQ